MSRLLRAGALVAVPVLVLGVLPAPAHAAEQQADDAASYLSSQLEGGLLTFENFGFPYTDFGGSVDAAVAFDVVGGHSADIEAIGNAISARLTDYVDYDYEGDDYSTNPPTPGPFRFEGRYSSNLAKAIVGLQVAGLDPETHPTGNLVEQLESLLEPAPNSGVGERIADEATKDGVDFPANNYANTFGQAFALTALRQAGSTTRADNVADYLVRQQCFTDGYFTENFVATGAECDDAGAASTDATALVASAFVPVDDNDSLNVLTKVVQYFTAAQRGNGGFGTGPSEAPNANSTGLAVAALRQIATIPQLEAYATPMAVKGATWLRAHQLENVGTCAPYASYELGAVAYDDGARGAGITRPTEGQFIKATAQSAEALLSAPSGPSALKARATAMYVPDDSVQTISVSGATPGSPVCLTPGRVQRTTSLTGSVALSVRVPARTATTTYTVTGADGEAAKAVIKSLGATTLGLRLRSTVRRGASQRVVVSGLAAGEKVSVRFAGRTVKSGTASSSGVLDTTFRVPASTTTGTRAVSVVGQFSDRKASKSFTVAR